MIDREDHDGIVTLRMRRGKANALDTELAAALIRALDESAESRAVILTGNESMFSAGVDLKRLSDGGAAYAGEFVTVLDSCLRKLFTFPRPVVAAINGHAIAGGCVLVAACDHRLMARGSGRIGVPELLVGVPFPSLVVEILRMAIPPPHLRSLMLHGKTYPPEEAIHLGMIDQIVEPEELLECALSEARELARIPALSFDLTKRLLCGPALDRVHRAVEVEREVRDAWQSQPVLGAIRDYVERTLKTG